MKRERDWYCESAGVNRRLGSVQTENSIKETRILVGVAAAEGENMKYQEVQFESYILDFEDLSNGKYPAQQAAQNYTVHSFTLRMYSLDCVPAYIWSAKLNFFP